MNVMTQATAAVILTKARTHPDLSRLQDACLLREMAYIDGCWIGAISNAPLGGAGFGLLIMLTHTNLDHHFESMGFSSAS